MQFDVLTDTSGNLPSERAAAAGLRIIPFTYTIDGQDYTCTDTAAFDGDSFYEQIRQGLSVTTTQISPQLYADFFRPSLEAGHDIIFAFELRHIILKPADIHRHSAAGQHVHHIFLKPGVIHRDKIPQRIEGTGVLPE